MRTEEEEKDTKVSHLSLLLPIRKAFSNESFCHCRSFSFKKNFDDSSWAIKKMPLKTVSLLPVIENVAVVF